jgi:rod shape-determining protein MreC
VHRRRYFAKPRLVICVPSRITPVEQRAVKEAGYQAGSRRVYIVEEPMAAAIGAGLPVHEATGNMVVDVGGGTTEVAVISLGGIVTSLSIRTAGDDLDQAIIAWMKKEHSLMLGERTAEEIKMTLGSAFPMTQEPEAEIRGRDMVSGLPSTVVVSSAEVRRALEEPFHARPDPARARRRHHGPRPGADRGRRAAAWSRRTAAPRDGDAGAHRRGAAALGRDGRRQVRGGVRGAAAGPRLGASAVGGMVSRRRRSSGSSPARRSARTVPALLVLAALTVITLDVRGGDRSPLEPVRSAVGNVVGPVETGTANAARPFEAVPHFFRTTTALRRDVSRLQTENSRLRGELVGAEVDRNRAAELDGLLTSAKSAGYALVPTRVVAMGPAQSFSRTVTIDAGTTAGVHADMTVLNNDGLVGRVTRADRFTSTVLLLVDQESVVGGRLGSSMEVGFLRGRGQVGDRARLDLDLVDASADVSKGDALVTWGSKNGAPYVAGIPIGRVTAVHNTPRQQSTQAVIEPYVDFSTLDLVGVVVPEDVKSDRAVIRADGSVRPSGRSR